MIDRRGFLTAAAASTALAGVGTLAACSPRSGPGTVRYWGQGGDLSRLENRIIDAFAKTEQGSGVTIRKSFVPSNGTGDATSIITAVRGGTAPDTWFADRYTVAQYASIGLLEPIDDMIAGFGGDVDEIKKQYIGFAIDELTYQGKLYGLPTESDTRALFYNKKLVRDAGLDLDELDPAQNPKPLTVDRLRELGDRMTKKNGRGEYTRIGWVPWDGQGGAMSWVTINGAKFFDNSTCEIDLTDSKVEEAEQYIGDEARRLEFSRVDAFKATYEPPNHPPAQTSFFGGHQGIVLQTPSFEFALRKYVPKLDFGVTNPPVFHEGDPPRTWSGGFSLVCPKGSSLSRGTWEFMKYYCGPKGQEIYMPAAFTLPTSLEVLRGTTNPILTKDLKFFTDLYKYSTSRPPLPVIQLWYSALEGAQASILLGSKTVKQALTAAQARVAPQMQLYCPFRLPANYGKVGTD